jgi:hypothetical protein
MTVNDRIRATSMRAAPRLGAQSAADRAAHESASHVRVLARIPAGHPRGSWPAEERADASRRDGQPADVVMDLDTDDYLVVARAVGVAR